MVNPPHVPTKKKKTIMVTQNHLPGLRHTPMRKGDTKDGYVKVEIGVVFSQTEGSLRRPEAGAGG